MSEHIRKRPCTIFFELSADNDKLLILPEDRDAFREFKRWAYSHLPKKGMYWDKVAEYYVILALETVENAKGKKHNVLRELRHTFDMIEGIKGVGD